MDATNRAPNVPISKFKRTKIIATLGPVTNNYASVLALIKAGVNGFRLNFSHATYEDASQQIAWIRKASKEYGKPVAIIQDLQGPKIRLGEFDGVATVQAGQTLRFGYKSDYAATGILPTQYDLAKKVKRGERLYLFDGRIRTKVVSIQDGVVFCRAENDGILISRKGINLPDTDLAGDIITPKDRKDMGFGSDQDIDYVALSFVQHASDIAKCRTILKNLGSDVKVIAKVETAAAADNVEEIIKEADMVMVARGDLAIETLPERVPILQRKIIGFGLKYATPTIVATQMLASMTEDPEPTRAEVGDVATAVILSADCVMLSDETAVGKYPVEAVETMKRVILYSQENNPVSVDFNLDHSPNRQSAISNAVLGLAASIGAKAIVAETTSGNTVLQVASQRPQVPLIGITHSNRVAQQLALVYGTKSYMRPIDKFAATKLTNWLSDSKVLKKGDTVVMIYGKYPGVVGTTDTIKVRMI
ncbi:MAG TPA: pyruvate kinase [Candidatus Saccharibacteria bacterium]|nr:pyruvate kinase [Candidatus Saccharibacteria bacterium]